MAGCGIAALPFPEFFQFFSFPVLKKRNQDLDYVINKGNMLPIEG